MGFYEDHLNAVGKRFAEYEMTIEQKNEKLKEYGWSDKEIVQILRIRNKSGGVGR